MHLPLPFRSRTLPTVLAAAVLALSAAAQQPLELVLHQEPHYWFSPSAKVSPGYFLEVADDFELDAVVHRVRVAGKSGFGVPTGDLHSVRVALYAWTPTGPGPLQVEHVLQDGDPRLAYTEGPGMIDVTLPTPFVAAGKHFLSVQVEVDGNWDWWCANFEQPLGLPVYSRTAPDGEWERYVIAYPAGPADADLNFELYGEDGTPPTAGTDPSGPWSIVPTPAPTDGTSPFLADVAALAPDDVWAVGDYTVVYAPPFGWKTFGWIQRWDGHQWTHVPSPNPEPYANGGYVRLNAVAAIAPDDVWAAGSYRVQNPSGGSLGAQVFLLHWDGTSWTHVPAPMSATGSGPTVNDILAFGPDDVWFFGQWLGFEQSPLGEQRSLAMHWDGSSFEITDTPFFDNYGGYGGGHAIEQADASGPDDVWAVGGAHGPDFSPHSYIVHWDGTSWTHVPGPTPGLFNRLFAVEVIAPDDVWASGFYHPESGGAYPTFYLHWDGSSWTQVDGPGGGRTLLHRPAAGDLVSSAGIYGGQGIFRWDGTSWTQVMDFSTTADPSVVALALVPGTDAEIWGVGRQNGPDAGALTVHLDPPSEMAKIEALDPCAAAAPPLSLLGSPTPKLGTHVSIAAGDPLSTAGIAPGSTAVLALGGALPGGCGLVVAGFGAGAAPGELLLADANVHLATASVGGPDAPAVFDLPVPTHGALLGLAVAAQAALVDPTDADVVLTRGLLLTIGP